MPSTYHHSCLLWFYNFFTLSIFHGSHTFFTARLFLNRSHLQENLKKKKQLYVANAHRDFLPQMSPQIQLKIYFVTSRQDWFGIDKLKNVFRSFQSHSIKLLQNCKYLLFSWTVWLTYFLPFRQAWLDNCLGYTSLIFALLCLFASSRRARS